MKYYTIAEMIEAIDEPNRSACRKLYDENVELFKAVPGSSHNHQAWEGGYFDHVTEVMNACVMLYPIYNVRGLNFTLSDALLVMFLHDIEKPWKDKIVEKALYKLEPDKEKREYIKRVCITDDFYNKRNRKAFRREKINEYGIILSGQHQNAMSYVEGENDSYSNKKRVMNELAAFCHIADVSSARIWHDYGRESKW